MGRTDTMKMATLPKIVDILNSVLLKSPTTFFPEKGKFKWNQKAQGKESNSEQEEKCWCGYSRGELPQQFSNFKNGQP